MKSGFTAPIGKITQIQGKCISLIGDDIDTDRIIPARFLKCVNFDSLGNSVFEDDRKTLNGKHPFDLEENKGASILIVNSNFGCGSSREHAPQALMRWGIRAIIGQSFAEIFFGNCLALGIPCATSTAENIKEIQKIVNANTNLCWELNLSEKRLHSAIKNFPINIESGPLEMLLTGRWDATSLLVSNQKGIHQKISDLPYLNNFK